MTPRAIAGVVAGAVVLMGCGDGAAQTTRLDPEAARVMFREAVLGFCAKKVLGRAVIPTAIDLSGPDWIALRDPQTTGGQRIFGGKVHRATSVIIDVSPSGGSCFVQADLPGARRVAAELRAELGAPPWSASSLEAYDNEDGRGVLFGLGGDESHFVPLIAVNENPTGDVVTAIVQRGQQSKTGS